MCISTTSYYRCIYVSVCLEFTGGCVTSVCPHVISAQTRPSTLPSALGLPRTLLCLYASSQESNRCCHCRCVLPVTELHISVLIQYLLLSVWLFSLRVMFFLFCLFAFVFLRFIRVARIWVSPSFIAE